MSYKRHRKPVELVEWEVISVTSGRTIRFADSIEEVMDIAEEFQMNPDIQFLGMDSEGHQAVTWSIDDVLNERFE